MLTFDRKRFTIHTTTHAAERERGQSLVEFAIGLVAILMIISGLLDIGRAYMAYVALEDAAGEAALYLAIDPNCPSDGTDNGNPPPPGGDGTPIADNGFGDSNPATADSAPFAVRYDCDPPNNAMWRAQRATSGLFEWRNSVQVVAYPRGNTVGEPVEVTIRYQFPLMTPIIPQIAGANSLTLTATASQIIVTE